MISPSLRWALTPVALLLVCIGGQVVLVRATLGQPGLTVDEGYDERARHFDDLEAASRMADALGWRLDVAQEQAGLVVRITDGAGQPVTGAHVEGQALALSGGDHGPLRLEERGSGLYGGSLPGPGRWELRLVVERDGARLVRTVLREAAP